MCTVLDKQHIVTKFKRQKSTSEKSFIFFSCFPVLSPSATSIYRNLPLATFESINFFKGLFFFKKQKLYIHSKIKRKIQKFSIYYLPHPCVVSSITNVPHKSGTFVKMINLHEQIINHQNPQFTVEFTRYCALYRFGQMYNNTCPLLWCHIEYFHYP